MEARRALPRPPEVKKVGVASFGYIGFADRKFFVAFFEEWCEEPIEWKIHEMPGHGKVSSILTTGDSETVIPIIEFFIDVIDELNRRAVFSKCFSGNPDLPIPQT